NVLNTKIEGNRVFLNDTVSRKKQVLPLIESMYSKGT
ncbi:MAG: hypothetical protein UR34_C0013G0001, partial [candidate division WS6 bacterium GW2011_GWC1_33_20]